MGHVIQPRLMSRAPVEFRKREAKPEIFFTVENMHGPDIRDCKRFLVFWNLSSFIKLIANFRHSRENGIQKFLKFLDSGSRQKSPISGSIYVQTLEARRGVGAYRAAVGRKL